MYGRNALFAGWVTTLTGHRPYECVSCGWRGWWAPANGDPTVVSIVLSFVARVAPSLVQRLRALDARLTEMKLPFSAAALKGAALLGILAGIMAALIALSAAATLPSDTVADDVSLRPPVDVQPQPVPAAPPPTPEAVPVAVTTPTPEPPVLAAAPAAPAASTTGVAASAAARSEPRQQAPSRERSAVYRGGLQVDSDPHGARVFIDGEEVGVTPIQLQSLPVGSRVVRVEAEGYQPWTTAARVVVNQRGRVSAVLQRSSQR